MDRTLSRRGLLAGAATLALALAAPATAQVVAHSGTNECAVYAVDHILYFADGRARVSLYAPGRPLRGTFDTDDQSIIQLFEDYARHNVIFSVRWNEGGFEPCRRP